MYVSHTDPHSGRTKLIHFACQFEALGSGISRIQKQFQNPESLRILELFSDSRYSTVKCLKLARKIKQLFSSRHLSEPRRKKLIHFACQFEALESRISQIQKQFQNPKSLRILELFFDSRYSTSKWLKLARKVNQLFSSRHYTDPHSGRKKSIHLRASLRHLKVEYRKSKNSSIILRLLGFWNCFRICNIPLPSASNWHAKWINFFRPLWGSVCETYTQTSYPT